MIRGTRITYNWGMGSTLITSTTRKACVIGPPIWTEDEQHLKYITDTEAEEGFDLSVNAGTDLSDAFKPEEDDYLVALGDLEFQISNKERGHTTKVTLDIGSAVNFKEGLGVTAITDFNSESETVVLDGIDYESFMLLVGVAVVGEVIDIAQVGTTDEYLVSDNTGGYIETNIASFEVGQTLEIDDVEMTDTPSWGMITNVNSVNFQLTVKDMGIGGGFDTTVGVDTFDFYYDYTGYTVNKARNPSLSFSIRALRPSISGKTNIADAQTLIDMFGSDSVENPDSVLAYDAMLFSSISNYAFYIYAFPIDIDALTATSISEVVLSNTYHTLAKNRLAGVESMIFVPCHRIETAADVSSVKTLLELWETNAVFRSQPGNKNETYVFGALPMLNKGYGYTDASAVLYGGADLSDDAEKYATELLDSIDPYDDYSYAISIPSTFDSQYITITNYYEWYSGNVWVTGSSIAAILAARRYNLIAVTSKNLAYVTTNTVVAQFANSPLAEYFTNPQLEAITDSGWQMLYSLSVGGVVKIGAQHTTNTASNKKEEHSILATFCLGQDIRSTLEPYLAKGINNQVGVDATNPKTIAYLKVLNSAISGQRSVYVGEGKIFNNLDIINIYQDTNNLNKMIIKLKLGYNYPITEHDVQIDI